MKQIRARDKENDTPVRRDSVHEGITCLTIQKLKSFMDSHDGMKMEDLARIMEKNDESVKPEEHGLRKVAGTRRDSVHEDFGFLTTEELATVARSLGEIDGKKIEDLAPCEDYPLSRYGRVEPEEHGVAKVAVRRDSVHEGARCRTIDELKSFMDEHDGKGIQDLKRFMDENDD